MSVQSSPAKEVERSDEFDKKFDNGEDVSKYLDFSKANRPGREQKRVNVDFPVWMIQSLDREARRLGVPRQSVIKVWIAERLEKPHP
ncbi:MAG: CopG family transcriptional regulator [Deltaproteobacteria bacterium]|nr:CopG family transcriptional regulator [Deltaproteobacteria bacterium]